MIFRGSFHEITPGKNPCARVAACLVPSRSQLADGEHKIDSAPVRSLNEVTVQQAQLAKRSAQVPCFRKYADQRVCGRAVPERTINHGDPQSSKNVDGVLRFA